MAVTTADFKGDDKQKLEPSRVHNEYHQEEEAGGCIRKKNKKKKILAFFYFFGRISIFKI